MPDVTLEVVSVDATATQGRVCRFSGVGGTIGRDDGCTMVLQDKHRRVSRLHASVTFPGGVPTIANESTTLPLSVGAQQLTHGQKLVLKGGELIEIGPFVLRVHPLMAAPVEVSLVSQRAQRPVSPAPAPEPLPGLTPCQASAADPLAGFMGAPVAGASGDPFADLLADLGAPSPQAPPPPVAAPVAVRPRPADPVLPSMSPVAQPAASDPDPFADLLLDLGSPRPQAPPQVAAAAPVFQQPVQRSPVAAALRPAAPRPDPFADLLGPVDRMGGDPFQPTSAARPGQPSGAIAPASAPEAPPWFSAAMPGRTPAAIIPEDFNPFELPSQTSRNAADPLRQMLGSADSKADVSIPGSDVSIDALFAPTPAAASPMDPLMGLAPAPTSSSGQGLDRLIAVDNSDPLLLFGGGAADPELSRLSPMRDDLPEIGGAYQPPRALLPEAASASSRSLFAPAMSAVSPDAGSVHATQALKTAFLQAAGLPAETLPGGLTPEVMALIGGLLRTATAGAIDMLAARAATKLELQASVTIISAQSNNPLKFLPNAESALQQMLGKKMPGFMRADQAMQDAFDDLRAHEVGVIAGTRAALSEVLGRFDPASLEKRLVRGSFLDSLVPAMRKTKLWEIYLEQFAKIRREAEDDFQSAFGRSFLEAYERETLRVKAHTTSGNHP